MNLIKTKFPIEMKVLEDYFTEGDESILDVEISNETHPKEVFIFLSNLDLRARLDFTKASKETIFAFLTEYMSTQSMTPIVSLIEAMVGVLLKRSDSKRVVSTVLLSDEDLNTFIDNNKKLVDDSYDFICSSVLYSLYTLRSPESGELIFKEEIESFPIIDDRFCVGLNLAYIFSHFVVGEIIASGKDENLFFYEKQFKNNIFKTDSFFVYYSQIGNPLNVIMNAHCLETEEAKYIVNELNNKT